MGDGGAEPTAIEYDDVGIFWLGNNLVPVGRKIYRDSACIDFATIADETSVDKDFFLISLHDKASFDKAAEVKKLSKNCGKKTYRETQSGPVETCFGLQERNQAIDCGFIAYRVKGLFVSLSHLFFFWRYNHAECFSVS